MLLTFNTDRSAQMPDSFPTNTTQRSIETLRAALPVLSAAGYYASTCILCIRVGHGEENGVSNRMVWNCLKIAATPLVAATAITGLAAIKKLCTSGCREATKILMRSICPEGLIRRVLFPIKEMEIIGQSFIEWDYAHARAIQ